ncbi:hypothetical protein Tco_0489030 [Tanacetum coccineum]
MACDESKKEVSGAGWKMLYNRHVVYLPLSLSMACDESKKECAVAPDRFDLIEKETRTLNSALEEIEMMEILIVTYFDDFERLRLRVEIFRILAGQITRFAAMADDGPAIRRRWRHRYPGMLTFDLCSEHIFSSKTLDTDACIQNEIADTSEARAAIYGSAHVRNQGDYVEFDVPK